MKNSKNQIEEQYHQLKNKVEDEIKFLQQKLSKNTQIHYHRSISSSRNLNSLDIQSNTEYKTINNISHDSHFNCCCHSCIPCGNIPHVRCSRHLCHHSCNSNNNSINIHQNNRQIYSNSRQNLLNNLTSTEKYKRDQQSIYKSSLNQCNKKTQDHSSVLQEAILKSIQNQKNISQNLKLLNQKIQKLSESKSQKNSLYSDNNYFNRQNSLKSQQRYSSQLIKTKPLLDEQTNSNPSKKYISSKSNKKKSIANKSKKKRKTTLQNMSTPSTQYLFNAKYNKKTREPTINSFRFKNQNNYQKLKQNWRSEYFGNQRLCPIHSKPKLPNLKSKEKQIYQDTYHRNRKHQRDHLIESFKQQKIARTKLISRILQTQGYHVKIK